jgi:hypothetical protein
MGNANIVYIYLYLFDNPASNSVFTHEIDIPNDFIQIWNSATASGFSLLLAPTENLLERQGENFNIRNISFFHLYSTTQKYHCFSQIVWSLIILQQTKQL